MNDLFMYRLGQKRGGGGSGGGGSADDWIGDGNTHIWISLQDGRTSPMLGVGVNGTVTVDWGDGSAPDTLTGTRTSTVVYTPVHEYKNPGDYVVTLSGDGEVGVLGSSLYTSYLLIASRNGGEVDYAYSGSIKKVELGSSVTSIANYAFRYCFSLASVTIPESVTSIGSSVFSECRSLASVTIPESVTSIGDTAFRYCSSLASVTIPESVTSIGSNVFSYCYSLASVTIPESVTSIGSGAFSECRSLASVTIPESVTSIGSSVFSYCYSIAFCDFSRHTAVPTLASTSAFSSAPSDFQIRVPAVLVDEWKAATNWSTYADKIVGV